MLGVIEFFWNPDEDCAEVRRSVSQSSITFEVWPKLDEFDVLCFRACVLQYFPLTKGYDL